ncbi:MAG: helix-turn-helix domain-containing protein [Acidobacteriota bacterium]|nr:helix-turn-helix domain-containing protein [Acidobacteriota bacterium]
MSRDTFDEDVVRIASLGDEVRRRLYRFVVGRDAAVSRDEAAAGVGVPRHTAKFHLDKLVDEGLLETEFRRLTDRQGPGAGRPAKLYRPSQAEVAVSLPDRDYELAGRLLAEAVTRAETEGTAVAEAVRAVSAEAGRRLGESSAARRRRGDAGALASLLEVLSSCGFEPHVSPGGGPRTVVLRNCPFHRLAQTHPGLVCGMNHEFVSGVLAGLGAARLTARLEPAADRCCVLVDAS